MLEANFKLFIYCSVLFCCIFLRDFIPFVKYFRLYISNCLRREWNQRIFGLIPPQGQCDLLFKALFH